MVGQAQRIIGGGFSNESASWHLTNLGGHTMRKETRPVALDIFSLFFILME